MKANSAVYQTIIMIKFIALMSACSPTQATLTNIPQPATTRAAVPTNTSAPRRLPVRWNSFKASQLVPIDYQNNRIQVFRLVEN